MLDRGEPTFVVMAAMTKLLTRLIMHSINICGTCQLELKRHSCPTSYPPSWSQVDGQPAFSCNWLAALYTAIAVTFCWPTVDTVPHLYNNIINYYIVPFPSPSSSSAGSLQGV